MLPTFLVPWAFLGLLALPALVVIYWLRMRSRPVVVSSLLLWQEQPEMRTGGLRFEALQTPLLFALEVLAIVLLVLAAASPWWQTSQGSQALVVVLDDSFSMQAGGDKSCRRQAVAALEQELARRRWHSIRLVLAGPTPQALGEPVPVAAQVRPLLEQWRCTAPGADLQAAIGFAADVGGPQARILVLSDHEPAFTIEKGRVQWWAFGQALPNLAIIQAGRSTREQEERCLLEIASFADQEQTTTLRLNKGPAGRESSELRLKPRETRRLTLRWPNAARVDALIPMEAQLDSDALDIDNRVQLLPRPRRPVRVAVDISNKDLRAHVEKALQAAGQVILTTRGPHLLITDRAETERPAQAWGLQFLLDKEAMSYLGPFLMDRSHPLLQGLSLQGVAWGAGKTGDVPGNPVILAGNVPLLTEEILGTEVHWLRLRLRPELSTLPELPPWPILIWNLVQWRSRALPGVEPVNVRLGDSTTITTADDSAEVEVTLPDGVKQTVAVHERHAEFQPAQVGTYQVRAGEQEYSFACNALTPAESDLSHCVSGRWGEWDEAETAGGFESLQWLLLLLAGGVLGLHLFFAARSG